ncbi:MAG: hypothetical protein QOJ81_103 [Chloroflexota bacterium]|nr:hypothetical protein [Chloroflexota bacterium]
MQSLIADTLRAWREAERVLTSLPPVDPNHEIIRGLVIELRSMYAKLAQSADVPAEAIADWQTQLESATTVLTRVRGESA